MTVFGLGSRGNVPGTDGAWQRPFNAPWLIAASWLAMAVVLPAEAAEPTKVLAFGDSLTAGYGLPEADSFTAQLEQALDARGTEVTIINGGVSGDTSAGGRDRLDWALGDAPQLVLLELGANDGLRGLDPAATRDNLDAVLATLHERGVPVLLLGMVAPPNLGPDYGAAFDAIYPELARKWDVPLYPFFLDGVAADPALNQPDGMHPNREGVARIVEKLAPVVEEVIRGLPPG
jgi:acyl-CoA thioesterase-1